MKKTKVIALVLCAAIMLMGAGYAAWTDKLQVNTTVNTGELDVAFGTARTFDGVWAYPHIFFQNTDGLWHDATAADYLDSSIGFGKMDQDLDGENDQLNFTFNNMYPGTQARGKYYMKNVGTIPAKIADVNVIIQTLAKGKNNVADLEGVILVQNTTFTIKRQNGTVETLTVNGDTLAQLDAKLKAFFVNKILAPKDEVYLGGEQINDYFIFEIPAASLNNSDGELETVKVTIDFDFKQHNM